jgi:hypothetical protein
MSSENKISAKSDNMNIQDKRVEDQYRKLSLTTPDARVEIVNGRIALGYNLTAENLSRKTELGHLLVVSIYQQG